MAKNDDAAAVIVGALCMAMLVIVGIAGALFIPALILWGAWVLVAVPVFGLPALTFWQVFFSWLAVGVVLTVLRRLFRG